MKPTFTADDHERIERDIYDELDIVPIWEGRNDCGFEDTPEDKNSREKVYDTHKALEQSGYNEKYLYPASEIKKSCEDNSLEHNSRKVLDALKNVDILAKNILKDITTRSQATGINGKDITKDHVRRVIKGGLKDYKEKLVIEVPDLWLPTID